MFTIQELNIMQSALGQWNGPYHYNASLKDEEQKRTEREIAVAQALSQRFRDILSDYDEISRRHIV
jgi:hypothetical protein